jgi:translation initiation factor IF-2
MRVDELAKDLKVQADTLLHLLREMGIHAADAKASLPDAAVARVLARVERERRAGKKDVSEALQAALEEASSGPRRRRRRRSSTPEPEPEPDTEEATASDATEDDVSSDEAAAPDESATEVVATEPEEVEVEVQSDSSAEGDEAETVVSVEEQSEAAVEVVEVIEEAAEVVEVPEVADEAAVVPEPDTTPADDAPTEVVVADAGEPVKDETPEAAAALAESPAPVAASPEGAAPATPSLEPARKNAPDGPVRVLRKPTPAASAGPGGTVRIQAEGYTTDGRRKAKDKKKKRGRVDQDAVQENISRVMAEIKSGGGKKKRRRAERVSREEQEIRAAEVEEEQEREAKTVKVNEFLTIAELAELMDVPAAQIVGSAFKNLGLMVTINQRLDFDQIEMLLDEFGFQAVREEDYASGEVEEVEEEENPEDLKPRPPVVTVMGHVDHGKTLLLDRIRKANVVAGEAGGITQHIGAYHVELEGGRTITFLDTPGHAAFTAMRARGADVTDIVILLVAADDSIMPQTIEAISHAKNAGVPLIVAINKVDLPAANPDRVKQELLQHDVQVEDYGGQVLASAISAKTGEGVDELLEKVVLQAELLELSANPDRAAQGAVIEAQLDVGKGPVVTVLVQKGTLRVGDDFLVGIYDGRVRALLDERGKPVAEVGPGIPVQVLGAGGVPQAGDAFQAMDSDRASEIATNRQRLDREKQLRIKERGVKLGDFSKLMAQGAVGTLPLIIKGDVDGSVQAVSDALEQLGTSEVQVEIIHRGVGAINESDVLLAETAGAVIIGFRVRPDSGARQLAEQSGVDVQAYDVIYNAVDDIRLALEGML